MENWIIKPFDLQLAKDIQSGKVKGGFLTKDGKSVRILCFDALTERPIIALVYNKEFEDIHCYFLNGSYFLHESPFDLIIKVPEEIHIFNSFDKVLVRNEDCEAWNARLYDIWFPELGLHGTQDNKEWKQCIPYEGNEHLVGTTNNPK